MALAFHTLTFPLSQRPVRGSVRVRPVQEVVLDGEQREVVQGPSSATLIDGVYVLDLDVLPDGYYHLITHPDGETITVVVPPGEPPHDSAHEVPGLTPVQYGWWVPSIRADNPAVPPTVTVGVASVTGSAVDNTDPRNPVIDLPAGNLPVGGTTGQALVKASDADNDVEWADPAGGGDVASVFGRIGPVVAEAGDYAGFYDPLGAADDAVTDAETYTDAETARAESAEAAEAIARANADTTLANLITTEATTRGNADATNAAAIANEVTRATGVEAVKADLVAGKVPTSQLPALAINEVFPVASQAAMLALTAQRGDIARRTDFTPNHLFLLTTDSPTTLGDWLLIVSDPGAGVDTVNGQSGTVVLGAADVGADTAAARDTAIANQHTTDVSLFQPADPDLAAIAGLDATTAGALVTDGAGWIRKTYAQLKTALGLVKGDVGLGNVDNTSDANKPVSTAQAAADATVLSNAQTYADGKVIDSIADADTSHAPSRNAVFDALALRAPLASPTLTGTVTVPTPANPTDAANKQYVDNAVVGLLDFRGSYDASVNTFPAAGGSGTAGAVVKGDVWITSVGGTLGGVAVTAGDLIVALADTPGQTAGNWDLVPHDGAYVTLTGNQTVAGTKTFSSSPVVPTPAAADNSTKAASTAYVDAADALAILKSIGTTKGDQIGFTGSGAPVRHAIGPDGTVQTADSTQADGWKWAAPSSGVSGRWGDGSDGNVTISVNTSLARDMYYDNLTINAGITLTTNGWRVYVRNTLTINATGVLGNPGLVGTGGTNNFGGGLGGGTNQVLPGGRGGGNGGTGAGSAGTSSTNTLVNSPGGAGGAGSSGAAGAAGPGPLAATVFTLMPKSPPSAFDFTFIANGSLVAPGGGGGGGGGGGDGTNFGAGGGGAGGVCVVNARILVNNGTISAAGGNGRTPITGNAGGGGGGGGGIVFVNTTSLSGSGTVTAAGGTHGNGVGTGANGVDGTAGLAQTITWSF